MKGWCLIIILFFATNAFAGIDNMRLSTKSTNQNSEVKQKIEYKSSSKPIYIKEFESWKQKENLDRASKQSFERNMIRTSEMNR